MKDEAYVKEILQKFGEAVDCYSQELRDKKIARRLRDLNLGRDDAFTFNFGNNRFESKNSSHSAANLHPRNMPSSNNKPPTTILEEGLQIQPSVFCEHGELRKDTGRIIFGLDKDSRPGRVNGVLSDPRLGKTTRGISGI